MVPSDDYWRHTSPWPGHDATTPSHAPGTPQPYDSPPLTGYDFPPAAPFGGYDGHSGTDGYGAYGGYGGTASAGGGFWLVAFVIFFWAVPHALALLVVLYPLATAIEIGAARGIFLLAGKFDTGVASTTQIAAAIVASLVLLWPVSHLEQRLANNRAYRIARHVVRLALLGLLVHRMTITMPSAEPLPQWMHPFRGLFRSPEQLAVTLGAVALWQLLLVNGMGIQTAWHRALEVVRLRRA
ncbi:MAG TPA: hypothetical protein VIM15_01965 [Gemmatimonadaceae bacterium]